MNRGKTLWLSLGMAFAVAATSGIAVAQPSSQQPTPQAQGPSYVKSRRVTATATISRIDKQNRELTLQDDQGKQFVVHVPKKVTRFSALKQGDRVNIVYYQSIGLQLEKQAGAQGAGKTTMTRRSGGVLPGGIVARQITGTVEVMSVDRANNTVTIRTPDGALDTINVSDPQLQSKLGNLKAGDRIRVTYREAAALQVTPAGQAQPGQAPPGQMQGQPQGQPQGQMPPEQQGQPPGQLQGQPQGQPQGQMPPEPQGQPQGQVPPAPNY